MKTLILFTSFAFVFAFPALSSAQNIRDCARDNAHCVGRKLKQRIKRINEKFEMKTNRLKTRVGKLESGGTAGPRMRNCGGKKHAEIWSAQVRNGRCLNNVVSQCWNGSTRNVLTVKVRCEERGGGGR